MHLTSIFEWHTTVNMQSKSVRFSKTLPYHPGNCESWNAGTQNGNKMQSVLEIKGSNVQRFIRITPGGNVTVKTKMKNKG